MLPFPFCCHAVSSSPSPSASFSYSRFISLYLPSLIRFTVVCVSLFFLALFQYIIDLPSPPVCLSSPVLFFSSELFLHFSLPYQLFLFSLIFHFYVKGCKEKNKIMKKSVHGCHIKNAAVPILADTALV